MTGQLLGPSLNSDDYQHVAGYQPGIDDHPDLPPIHFQAGQAPTWLETWTREDPAMYPEDV